jgi:hypothetical protein
MKADKIEELVQRAKGNFPHALNGPQCMYVYGRTAVYMARETTDFQAFEPDALYCFSPAGIWRMD